MESTFENQIKLITEDNWTYCHYKQLEHKAMIHMGADPEKEHFIYYLNVLDKEDKDIFQKEFDSINLACQFINSNYYDWDFINQLESSDDGGGCSSCSAH